MADELTEKLRELGFVQKQDLPKMEQPTEKGITIEDVVSHIDKPCQDGDTPCMIHSKIDHIKQEAMEKGIIYGSELEKRKH